MSKSDQKKNITETQNDGELNELEMKFEEYAERIFNCGKKFDDSTMLELYGFYKQATCGDCSSPEPNFFDFKGRAKWNAWNEHQGMSQDHAMKRYINRVKKLL